MPSGVAILSCKVIWALRPGSFFRFKDGHPITQDRLVTEMRKAMSLSGINPTLLGGLGLQLLRLPPALRMGTTGSLQVLLP